MAVTEELVDKIRASIGESAPEVRGTITTLMAQRYARSIGEDNPLYLDEDHARSKGHDGLLVAPNFLPSYMDWSDGGAESELRPDGTAADDMAWVPLEGVRLMGGGEEMIFHQPLVADSEVVLNSVLDDVSSRESRSGPMLILTIRNTYTTSDGAPILTSIRTVLGR